MVVVGVYSHMEDTYIFSSVHHHPQKCDTVSDKGDTAEPT